MTATSTAEASSLRDVVGPQLGDVAYWRSEVSRLRQMWGEKTFWDDPEKAGRAMKGLLYVWANTDGVSASDEAMMAAATIEYDLRLLHALLRPNGADERPAPAQPK